MFACSSYTGSGSTWRGVSNNETPSSAQPVPGRRWRTSASTRARWAETNHPCSGFVLRKTHQGSNLVKRFAMAKYSSLRAPTHVHIFGCGICVVCCPLDSSVPCWRSIFIEGTFFRRRCAQSPTRRLLALSDEVLRVHAIGALPGWVSAMPSLERRLSRKECSRVVEGRHDSRSRRLSMTWIRPLRKSRPSKEFDIACLQTYGAMRAYTDKRNCLGNRAPLGLIRQSE